MARLPLHLNTRTFTSHLFFGPYIFIPLIGGLTWLGGILALLLLWVTDGKPRYRGDEASVVFISDVGAVHKTLFIVICSVTAGCYVLSLFAERWLRHIDRLPVDLRIREKIFDWLAICFGIIGSAALILLSVFDTFNHSTVHWSMTLVFIVGIALSAIFQAGEIWSLHKDHPDRKSLLRNSIYKLIVVGFAVACAICFGATYAVCGGDAIAKGSRSASTCNRITSVAAAFEWTIAFILVFFFLTIVADLWPAGKSSARYMRRLARWQEKHGEGDDFTGRRAFAEYPERWEGRYEGMRQAMYERNTGQEKAPRDSMASGAPMVNSSGPGMGSTPPNGYAAPAANGVAYPERARV
ncbi:Frag1/DRAM/Sfk1 family-domain-containing protein [Papiliotrema laurentii]|uniref:Frag1/DRAM/Sfk1 family-domain-containing protein n=1 Tax=Papiliotrema laurentii TaxID=5418 RepID=A0AAD9FXC1_PAPLA|nr:Frag1/DRAM/Sfk1 family-domain-containing protein [Papiliotrema laurentii]